MSLGRKQSVTHEDFQRTLLNIKAHVSRQHLDNLIDKTVSEIKRTCRHKRAAFSWSGGKDAQVLRSLCELAGIENCILAMTHGLEFPEFLRWVTDNMPWRLEVMDTGQDLRWLAEHQHMLFPQDSRTAARWFKIVQHRAQAEFFERRGLDLLLLGRRWADGNFTGGGRRKVYRSNGVNRYSPIAHWSHEEVFAFIQHYNVPLPPVYSWPRGFRVGTGAWPMRQWTGSVENGWAETFIVDPNIVHEAATLIPSARRFLRKKG